MQINRTSRVVIIGNSGSGKSTLARRIGGSTGLPVHHLDPIRWEGMGIKRDAAAATQLVRQIAERDAWIVEGVFGWLAEIALPHATDLVWIDLSWDECRDGLERRGHAQRGSTGAFKELLSWAGDYWTRTSSSSFIGHASLYQCFRARKLHLRSRAEVSDFTRAVDFQVRQ